MSQSRSSADFAALHQQVLGLDKEQQELRGAVVAVDRKMDAGFANLNSKLDARSATPWSTIWSALAVLMAFVVTIGALAYWPIRETQQESKAQQLRDAQMSYDRDVRLADRLRIIEGKQNYLDGFLRPLTK